MSCWNAAKDERAKQETQSGERAKQETQLGKHAKQETLPEMQQMILFFFGSSFALIKLI